MVVMGDGINLADPSCEPSDAELQGLSSRAFANVRAAHAARMEGLRKAIEAERANVLRWLAEVDRSRPPT